jgi:hypothetical protein
VIFVLCIGLTALGLRNTYADNTEEQRMAEQLACSAENCSTNLMSVSRSALGQSFVIQVIDKKNQRSQNAGVVNIECARAYVFLGDYKCERKD